MNDIAVPTFSLAERDRRWELARGFMKREGLDALLVFGGHEDGGPAPVGYDTWFTNDRPGTTVIFPRGPANRSPSCPAPCSSSITWNRPAEALITVHSLNRGLSLGKGRGDISWLPGAEAYPPVCTVAPPSWPTWNSYPG